VSLASLLATLAALEVGFRLAGVSVGTVQINRATVRRTDNPRLRFDLRPGSAVRAEVLYRVNAEGFRGEETTVEKPAGVRRVAVLGDSIAFGYWVADEDGFPRQLEAMLNPAGAKGDRVEVLNFGVPGYNLDQEIEALRTKALAFSPDLVVLAFCLNDLEGLFSYELGLVQDRATRSRSWAGRWRESLLGRSLLLSWIEYRLSELEARRSFARARNPLGGPLYAEAVSQQRAALTGKLSVLRSLLASRSIPGVVVVFPVLGGRFEQYPHRELHRAVVEAAEGAGFGAGPSRLLLGLRLSRSAHRRRPPEPARPPGGGPRDARRAVRPRLAVRGRATRAALHRLPPVRFPDRQGLLILTAGRRRSTGRAWKAVRGGGRRPSRRRPPARCRPGTRRPGTP
jgi:hypothetical protein